MVVHSKKIEQDIVKLEALFRKEFPAGVIGRVEIFKAAEKAFGWSRGKFYTRFAIMMDRKIISKMDTVMNAPMKLYTIIEE